MGDSLSIYEGSADNRVTGNTVPDSRLEVDGVGCSAYGSGINVTQDTAGNRLIRNTVLGVPGDGIHVDSPATTLIRNTANFNGDYGIEAVPGVESGVNFARGNGNPLQCLNVRCLLRPGRAPAAAGG